MRKYEVEVTLTVTIEVEAQNQKEAKEEAMEAAASGYFENGVDSISAEIVRR